MSLNIPQIGNPKPVILDLTTTDPTTIYTSTSAQLRGLLNSLSVCNDSGGAATFTLTLTDNNGLAVKIYNLKSVPSNDSVILTDHEIPIPNGWTLAITATSANTLHVVAVVIELAVTRG
jgi:hypothetical protein